MSNELASKEQVERWARQIGEISGMPTYGQLKEQLAASKQRELKLLAVIDLLPVAVRNVDFTALREHEAKVREEFILSLRKKPSIGLSERQFGELRRMAEERRKK